MRERDDDAGAVELCPLLGLAVQRMHGDLTTHQLWHGLAVLAGEAETKKSGKAPQDREEPGESEAVVAKAGPRWDRGSDSEAKGDGEAKAAISWHDADARRFETIDRPRGLALKPLPGLTSDF